MVKRTIEIEDTLDDCVQSARDVLKDYVGEWILDNLDREDKPDIAELDYSGAVHEIIDGCVPIYYCEIDTAWFLHKNELTNAYEDSGIGDNPMENGGATAIFCYIEQEVYTWYEAWDDDYEDWALFRKGIIDSY